MIVFQSDINSFISAYFSLYRCPQFLSTSSVSMSGTFFFGALCFTILLLMRYHTYSVYLLSVHHSSSRCALPRTLSSVSFLDFSPDPHPNGEHRLLFSCSSFIVFLSYIPFYLTSETDHSLFFSLWLTLLILILSTSIHMTEKCRNSSLFWWSNSILLCQCTIVSWVVSWLLLSLFAVFHIRWGITLGSDQGSFVQGLKDLVLVFWKMAIMLSVEVGQIYIPTNINEGSPTLICCW